MRSVHDVRAWLGNLQDEDMLWHLEDNPATVNWSKPVSKARIKALDAQRKEAFRIGDKAGVDVFTLYPDLPGQLTVQFNEDQLRGLRWALGVALDEYEGTKGPIALEWELAKEALDLLGDAA